MRVSFSAYSPVMQAKPRFGSAYDKQIDRLDDLLHIQGQLTARSGICMSRE
jgi:hypothetical protein